MSINIGVKATAIKLLAAFVLMSGANALACDYIPSQCEAFKKFPGFVVPAFGSVTQVMDLSHCGGLVQNLTGSLMNARRREANSKIEAFDSKGNKIGNYLAGNFVYLPNGLCEKITFVISSQSKRNESCLLEFSLAI